MAAILAAANLPIPADPVATAVVLLSTGRLYKLCDVQTEAGASDVVLTLDPTRSAAHPGDD